jgi:hypothetical protein
MGPALRIYSTFLVEINFIHSGSDVGAIPIALKPAFGKIPMEFHGNKLLAGAISTTKPQRSFVVNMRGGVSRLMFF